MDFEKLLQAAMNDTTPDEVLEERINMEDNTRQYKSTEAFVLLVGSQQERAEALQKEQALEKVIEECSEFDEKEFN